MSIIPQELFDNLDAIIDLHLKQVDTYRKYKDLMRMADLMGIPPKDLKGPVGRRYIGSGRPLYGFPWKHDHIAITHNGQEVVRVPLLQTPKDWWPDDVRLEYERHQRRVIRSV